MRKPDHEGNEFGAPVSPPPTGRQADRPAELEDWLNRTIYHPASYRLALALKDTFVTPNALSILGGVTVVFAAILYAQDSGPLWAAAGLLTHAIWHVLDGADGDLARLTAGESAFGEVVDGACDYLSQIVLYLVLASILASQIGEIGWPLMILAGFARVAQAAYFETQRRQYQWWVYGKPWLRLEPGESVSGRGFVSAFVRAYMRLSDLFATGGAGVDARIADLEGERRAEAAAIVRRRMRGLIIRLSPLSANYRTLVIGAAMIADTPIAIVIFELVVLSAYMVGAMVASRRLIASTSDQIAAISER